MDNKYNLFDDICLLYDVEEKNEIMILLLNIYLVMINYKCNLIQSLTLVSHSIIYSIIRGVKEKHTLVFESIYLLLFIIFLDLSITESEIDQFCLYLPYLDELYFLKFINCKLSERSIEMIKSNVKLIRNFKQLII